MKLFKIIVGFIILAGIAWFTVRMMLGAIIAAIVKAMGRSTDKRRED